jgi:isoprenylcysteine carboxyl methyltransferase (ICMT) family protein YpbQ
MEVAMKLTTITDWIVLLVIAFVLCVIYAGWLASYRTPKASLIGTSIWFRLPAWGQIAAGLVISVVGAYGSYLLWIPIPVALSPGISLSLRIGGLLIVLSGVPFFLWARRTLGALYNTSTSSAVQLHANHRLIQHGAFALVRHPIYLSYWLMLFGLLVIYRTWMPLLALVMMIISLSNRARREDQVLAATFGEAWQEYAERVPMFLPQRRMMKPRGT